MASIATDKRGNRRIQFTHPNGERKTVYLGNVEMTVAETVKKKIKTIVDSISFKGDIDPDIPRWLAIHPKLATKLAKVGLVTAAATALPDKGILLATFIDRYIAKRTDAKPNTHRTWRQTRALLLEQMGSRRKVADVTELDAKEFHGWLSSTKKAPTKAHPETDVRRFAPSSVTKYTALAGQVFAAAVDARLIKADPFRGIKLGRKSNKERQQFIHRDVIDPVLERCIDPEMKLVIALARYGGLRIPSELDGLLWEHVDRDRNRILITSPKTEHHEGGATREIPLFPELVPYLDGWLKELPKVCGHIFVSNRQSESGWRTRMYKLLDRLKIPHWKKVFQNLRSTRQTELLDAGFPRHVVCAWMGNSEDVADEHYNQVTDEHFERAIDSHTNEKRREKRRNYQPKSTANDRNRIPENAKSPRKSRISRKSSGADGNRTHLAPLQTPRRV